MPKSYLKEFRNSIILLLKQGPIIQSLAKDYDVSANTISRWLK